MVKKPPIPKYTASLSDMYVTEKKSYFWIVAILIIVAAAIYIYVSRKKKIEDEPTGDTI